MKIENYVIFLFLLFLIFQGFFVSSRVLVFLAIIHIITSKENNIIMTHIYFFQPKIEIFYFPTSTLLSNIFLSIISILLKIDF
jgi:hypothetical protein